MMIMDKMEELPTMVKITGITDENPYVKTLFLDWKGEAKPGQFVMVWIPGVDEKPFTLSHTGKRAAITVEEKGKYTKALFGLKEGGMIGVRGPYGNPFVPKANACVVAGGLGLAALAPLIEALKAHGKEPRVIIGARTRERLIFNERFGNAAFATDDGSFGRKGFVTDLLEEALAKGKFSVVYTCGPEAMMKRVFEMCERRGIEVQASLERYMKCGLGVCGQCEADGMRVCRDGPVFASGKLRNMSDFGKFARLKTGEKVSVAEYAGWRSE